MQSGERSAGGQYLRECGPVPVGSDGGLAEIGRPVGARWAPGRSFGDVARVQAPGFMIDKPRARLPSFVRGEYLLLHARATSGALRS